MKTMTTMELKDFALKNNIQTVSLYELGSEIITQTPVDDIWIGDVIILDDEKIHIVSHIKKGDTFWEVISVDKKDELLRYTVLSVDRCGVHYRQHSEKLVHDGEYGYREWDRVNNHWADNIKDAYKRKFRVVSYA